MTKRIWSLQVTKETTLRLYSIFDKTLLESLQLTEGKQGWHPFPHRLKKNVLIWGVVTKIQSESGRTLYRVSNECISELEDPAAQEITNTCMINPKYCNCDKFIQDVIFKNDMIMVKEKKKDIFDLIIRHYNNQMFEYIHFSVDIFWLSN